MWGGKRENSGRKPGVQNQIAEKQRQEYRDKFPDFNPLIEAVEIYKGSDDDKVKIQCLELILKKTIPDLKAVEHSTSEGTTLYAPIVLAPGASIEPQAMGGVGTPDGQPDN